MAKRRVRGSGPCRERIPSPGSHLTMRSDLGEVSQDCGQTDSIRMHHALTPGALSGRTECGPAGRRVDQAVPRWVLAAVRPRRSASGTVVADPAVRRGSGCRTIRRGTGCRSGCGRSAGCRAAAGRTAGLCQSNRAGEREHCRQSYCREFHRRFHACCRPTTNRWAQPCSTTARCRVARSSKLQAIR
jgi:hypothetical protein